DLTKTMSQNHESIGTKLRLGVFATLYGLGMMMPLFCVFILREIAVTCDPSGQWRLAISGLELMLLIWQPFYALNGLRRLFNGRCEDEWADQWRRFLLSKLP